MQPTSGRDVQERKAPTNKLVAGHNNKSKMPMMGKKGVKKASMKQTVKKASTKDYTGQKRPAMDINGFRQMPRRGRPSKGM